MKAIIWIAVFILVVSLIAGLPAIVIDVDSVIASSAFSYIRAACYFIPVEAVAGILSIIIGLWILRVIVTVAKTVWDLLPVK